MKLTDNMEDLHFDKASATDLLALFDALPRPARRVMMKLCTLANLDPGDTYALLSKLTWLMSGLAPTFSEGYMDFVPDIQLEEFAQYKVQLPLPKADIAIINDQLHERFNNPFLSNIRERQVNCRYDDMAGGMLAFVEVLHQYLPRHCTRELKPRHPLDRPTTTQGLGLDTGRKVLGGRVAGLDTGRRSNGPEIE